MQLFLVQVEEDDEDDLIDIEALAQAVADLTAKGTDIRVVDIVTQDEAIR